MNYQLDRKLVAQNDTSCKMFNFCYLKAGEGVGTESIRLAWETWAQNLQSPPGVASKNVGQTSEISIKQ